MSILTNRTKKVSDVNNDDIFVIYGNNGTGKTALAATFPKTAEAPLLILDIKEKGVASIALKDRENVLYCPIETYEEFVEVFNDIYNGFTFDDDGTQRPLKISSLVIDSATQLETMIQRSLLTSEQKTHMTQQLYGFSLEEQNGIYNLAKTIADKNHIKVVIICHQVEKSDNENPGNNKIIPSLSGKASYSLCAKASYVWYTKVEDEPIIDPKTNQVTGTKSKFVTYIDATQAYLTKTRKPVEMKIPLCVENLTYDKFKKNVIDKIARASEQPKDTQTQEK